MNKRRRYLAKRRRAAAKAARRRRLAVLAEWAEVMRALPPPAPRPMSNRV